MSGFVSTAFMTSGMSMKLVDSMFNEGIRLTVEARNYIAHHEQADKQTMDVQLRLQASYQQTRVTARLTQIMAWLLAIKALNQGEILPEDFTSEDFALATGPECMDASGADIVGIPVGLRDLLERTHRLYARIARLDTQYRNPTTSKRSLALITRAAQQAEAEGNNVISLTSWQRRRQEQPTSSLLEEQPLHH